MGANKAFFLFVLFLAKGMLVNAYDCSMVSSLNQDACISIMGSQLSDDDKDLLACNLDYESKFFPDHSFILEKNKAISVIEPPYDAVIKNGNYIRNAWVSLLAVMPSVSYMDELFVPDSVEVLSAYDYDIVLPKNYVSPGYPSTSSRDCKRTYRLKGNSANSKVYVDGALKGSGEDVNLSIASDSVITSSLVIKASVEIKHYSWDSYCCGHDFYGFCNKHCYNCNYDHTSSSSETLTVSDSIPVKHNENNLSADVSVMDKYEDNVRLSINYSDSFRLSFPDSGFEYDMFSYDIAYSKEPYYFLILHATDYGQESSDNLFSDRGMIITKGENCAFEYFDFFKYVSKDCNLGFDYVELNISTDRLSYVEGDNISVIVYPADLHINITYGNMTREAVGKASFIADKDYGKITAEYGHQVSERFVAVSEKEHLIVLWNFSVFGFINYFLYALLRKYWGGLLP